jgi:hypothetical protein
VGLDKEDASTAFRYQYLVPSPYLCFLLAFGFTRDFCVAMGLKGQIILLFWCLMPKGEKLRLKQLDQLPLVNFKIFSESILGFLSKLFYCKKCSTVGEKFDYEKRGSFWYLTKTSLESYFNLPKQVFLT